MADEPRLDQIVGLLDVEERHVFAAFSRSEEPNGAVFVGVRVGLGCADGQGLAGGGIDLSLLGGEDILVCAKDKAMLLR